MGQVNASLFFLHVFLFLPSSSLNWLLLSSPTPLDPHQNSLFIGFFSFLMFYIQTSFWVFSKLGETVSISFHLVCLREDSMDSSTNRASEESGWTTYFEDFLTKDKNESSVSSYGYMGSSMVSDAASFVALKPSNYANSLMGQEKNCTKLNFKKRKIRVLEEDPLEDTASSPASSPKVSDLRKLDMNPSQKDDNIDISPGKEITTGGCSELQTEERNVLGFLNPLQQDEFCNNQQWRHCDEHQSLSDDEEQLTRCCCRVVLDIHLSWQPALYVEGLEDESSREANDNRNVMDNHGHHDHESYYGERDTDSLVATMETLVAPVPLESHKRKLALENKTDDSTWKFIIARFFLWQIKMIDLQVSVFFLFFLHLQTEVFSRRSSTEFIFHEYEYTAHSSLMQSINIPVAKFHFVLSPMQFLLTENRKSLLHFITNVSAIIGCWDIVIHTAQHNPTGEKGRVRQTFLTGNSRFWK
ncbi:uncharacterized protein LOC143892139 [Tasmannia lanceolata]|uniref:uncharacterized protein LOC143892139 n=1 Tax=Tasmannia lanceolata TaxID=3420 RepID=UPI004064824C